MLLVPELAVQMIMEDMDVSQAQARSILQESIWVGELLNEERENVMTNEESDNESTSPLTSLSGFSDEGEVINKTVGDVADDESRDRQSTSSLSSHSGSDFDF
jgi:hypothetical protein